MTAYIVGRIYQINHRARKLLRFIPCEYKRRRGRKPLKCQLQCSGLLKFSGKEKSVCGYDGTGKQLYRMISMFGRG